MATRITGGIYLNRSIEVRGIARPTGARVREALFSILSDDVSGAFFADLFAGSGAVGFEAISRGASYVLFVESASERALQIRTTARALGITEDQISVQRTRLPALPRVVGRLFDIVFLDPPYDFTVSPEILSQLRTILHSESIVVYEHSFRSNLTIQESGLVLQKTRRFGDSSLSFLRVQS